MKEINPKGYEIPDLSKATFIKTRHDDLTDKIEGRETRVEEYEMGKKRVHKVSINDKIFLYSFSDDETEDGYAIADLDGDGVFETKYNIDDLTFTKPNTGEKISDFPAKKELPPEWVLK